MRKTDGIKTPLAGQGQKVAGELPDSDELSMVCDVSIPRQATLFELDGFFAAKEQAGNYGESIATGLQPIVKWPGGKEKELKYILRNAPRFERFFDPFVGGGSVFMAIQAKEYYINDLSPELISLYRNIASSGQEFFHYVELMDDSWKSAASFFDRNRILVETYLRYRNGEVSQEELKTLVRQFCRDKEREILDIVGGEFLPYSRILVEEMETNIFRKMSRMRELEIKKRVLPDRDLLDNLETAIKSAVYMNYRHMYNDHALTARDEPLHCALFFFMRNYAYSGMFRYSGSGDFNVPYGGIAYNGKSLARKLRYYRSRPLLSHFANARIYNLDFEAFLKETLPTKHDFVFLDPPYDSDFSTYAQNAFTKADHERLARLMIDECKAKWMMIIKNTEFIHDLYKREGVRVQAFDKEYLVSFMNRNDKKVTHLLITNY